LRSRRLALAAEPGWTAEGSSDTLWQNKPGAARGEFPKEQGERMNTLTRFAARMGLLAGLAACAGAYAQNYPTKPVRIIEPHQAGSVIDNVTRGVAQALTQGLGQPFVIENRFGAEGMIGAEACAKAAPDGYSLCVTDSLVVSLNPVIRTKLTYDPPREFAPVVHIGFLSSAVVAHPSLPVNSMVELIALAKSKPGAITWGSWGLTSLSTIYIEWLKNAKGISFYNVPYKSALQSTQAVLAGEINVSVFGASPAVPLAKAGKLKVLATNGEVRSSLNPDVPSFKEAGIDVFIRAWFGMFAPMGTPREMIQRVNAVAGKAISDPQFREKFLASQGVEFAPPAGASADQFASFFKADREMCERVVAVAGLKE
jgi:tripartite-type tricarboxylate transporter receptor subunit TctC